jgi:hypothetical protein
MRSVAVCLSAVLALSSVAGCGVATTQSDSDDLGQLQLPLVTSTGDTLFRLSAQFIITDLDTGVEQFFDAGGDAPSLQVTLAPGTYRVTIGEGFTLERSISGGPLQAVPAVLASAKAVDVFISPGIATFISFQFLIANDAPNTGVLNVTFGVSVRRGQLVGTLFFHNANGVFEPYLQALPPTFVAPYAIGGEASISDPPTHAFFSGGVGFTVLNDNVGVLLALAPNMAGGNLSFQFETRPDDSQRFTLLFPSAFGAPFSQLFLLSEDLQPRVPVNAVRIADDPVLSQFRAVVPFQLAAGVFAESVATGVIDLQFVP